MSYWPTEGNFFALCFSLGLDRAISRFTAGFIIATAHPPYDRGVVFFFSRQVVQRPTGVSATSHLERWDVAAGNPALQLILFPSPAAALTRAAKASKNFLLLLENLLLKSGVLSVAAADTTLLAEHNSSMKVSTQQRRSS